MTIVKRLVKGSPLTNAELDGNFTDLDGRASTAQAAATAAASAAAAASTTAGTAATNAATALAAANAKPSLQSGALAASASLAPNATAVQNAINSAVQGVVVGSTDPLPTPYSTSIPLDLTRGREMGGNVLTGNVTLTIASSPAPIINGFCNVTLIGNGSAIATWPGVELWDETYAWNAADGAQNELTFFRRANTTYLLGKRGPILDTSAPAFVAAVVQNAMPTHVVMQWSPDIDLAAISAPGQFTVTGGHSVTAHDPTTPPYSYLTIVPGLTAGESVQVSYAVPSTNKMKDLSGNFAPGFVNQPVANYVAGAPSTTKVRLNVSGGSGQMGALVGESGNGTDGYNYFNEEPTSCFQFADYSAVSTTKMPANAAASIRWTMANANQDVTWSMSFSLNSDPTYPGPLGSNGYASCDVTYAIGSSDGVNPTYRDLGAGADVVVAAANGDVCEFVRQANGTVTFRVSKNGGSSWTTTDTFTTDPAEALYFLAQFGMWSINNLIGTGFVAP